MYVRKSSEGDERQVQSIDSQIKELEDLNARLGRKIVAIKSESHSAKNPREREVFNEMLKGLSDGKADGIIVWHPNRLSRNAIDTGELIYLMDKGALKEIITPSQTFKNDPQDKFWFNFMCLQAKLENDNKGIDVKRGMKRKAERGWLPGPVPIGYMNDPHAEKGNKTVLKDPARFDKMERLWRYMLTGRYNPSQLLRIATDEWNLTVAVRGKKPITKLSRSGIYRVLTNHFYYGMFEYPAGSGNWIEGKHEPMISKSEFLRVQELLSGKSKPRPQVHEFTYAGLFSCATCGASITPDFKVKHQKNGNIHHYTYCRCTKQKRNIQCPEKAIEIQELERQILVELRKLTLPQEIISLALEKVQDKNTEDRAFKNQLIRERKSNLTLLRDDLQNLIRLYGSKENRDGSLLSKEEFVTQKNGITEKIDISELEIYKLEKSLPTDQEAITSYNLAQKAHDTFRGGSPEEKRRILIDIYDKMLISKQQVILMPRQIFQLIGELQDSVTTPRRRPPK